MAREEWEGMGKVGEGWKRGGGRGYVEGEREGLEVLFEVQEELLDFEEGVDKLLAVGILSMLAELVADAVERIAAVAGEVIDLFQESDVLGGVVARAFCILVRRKLGNLRFPEAEQRGVDAQHVGDLPYTII